MKLWTWKKENLPWPLHAVRTAVAATVSVVVERLVGMPEAYWAAIATRVVMQSTLAATLTLAIERIVATAVGASIDANYLGSNLVAFAFSAGEDRVPLRRYYPCDHRPHSARQRRVGCRTAPFYRSFAGILVGLAVVALWPERERLCPNAGGPAGGEATW